MCYGAGYDEHAMHPKTDEALASFLQLLKNYAMWYVQIGHLTFNEGNSLARHALFVSKPPKTAVRPTVLTETP